MQAASESNVPDTTDKVLSLTAKAGELQAASESPELGALVPVVGAAANLLSLFEGGRFREAKLLLSELAAGSEELTFELGEAEFSLVQVEQGLRDLEADSAKSSAAQPAEEDPQRPRSASAQAMSEMMRKLEELRLEADALGEPAQVLQVQPFVDETEVAVAPDDAATDDAVAEGSGLALPLLGGADVDLEDDDDDLASLLGYGGGDAFASGDEGSESRPLPPLEIKKALDFELPVGEGQWNDAELERVVRAMDAHFGEMPAPPAVDNSEPLDAPGAPGISGDDDTGPSGAER